jgi:hypothetical protein
VDFVTSLDTVVDDIDAIANRRGANINDLSFGGRHQVKANAGLALGIVVEELAVDALGGKGSLSVGQIAEEGNDVFDIIANGCVYGAVAVLPDLVDPVAWIDLVWLLGGDFDPGSIGVLSQNVLAARVLKGIGLVVDSRMLRRRSRWRSLRLGQERVVVKAGVSFECN